MLSIHHATAADAAFMQEVGMWPPSPLMEQEIEAMAVLP